MKKYIDIVVDLQYNIIHYLIINAVYFTAKLNNTILRTVCQTILCNFYRKVIGVL